jgi:DNA-binding SARP family transcriptional activator
VVVTRQLDVRLLGEPSVLADGRIIDALASPRLLSLLALLIVHRATPLSRQRVAFTFWPDSSETQARTNLRQALHHLRRAMPDAERHLHLDGPLIGWREDSPARVDLVEHEAAVCAADAGLDRALLAAAIDSYAGDFLPGVYDDWVAVERDRLRRAHHRRLEALAGLHEEEGDVNAAVQRAEQLVAADPINETGYRRLMRLLGATDRARALRAYHVCVRALDHELGVAPGAETTRFYETLLAEQRATDAPAPLAPPQRPALTGREPEWAVLTAVAGQALDGATAMVLVSGEPGIGKSRLIDELVTWATRRGATCATSRAYQAEGRSPYGPIVELLRQPPFRVALQRLDDVWRGEVARLLPELAARGGPAGPADRTRVRDALARALAGTGRPLVVVIDDLQWCDAESLSLVHYVVRSAGDLPLLVVGAARDDALGSEHPLGRMLDELRVADAVVEIPLGRLDTNAATVLARQLVDGATSDAEVAHIVAESEGNPLFVVELARAGFTDGPQRPLPRKVQAVISSHLAQLSPLATDVVGAAAVIGRTFDGAQLAHVLNGRRDEVVDALDELWRRRVVRIRGTDTYDFSHDRIRDVAYAAVGPARRRELHRRSAHAVLVIHGPRDELSAQVAAHYELAGDSVAAIEHYHRALDLAARVYAHDEVEHLAERVLAILGRWPQGRPRAIEELAILDRLLVATMAGQGDLDRADQLHARIGALRTAHDLPAEPATLRLTANTTLARLRFREADDIGRKLLDLAGDDDVVRTEGHYVRGVCRFWLGDLVAAEHHLAAALAAFRPEHALRHLRDFAQDTHAICLVRAGLTAWHLGNEDRARALRCEAIEAAEATGHAYTQAYVRCFGAWMACEVDDVATVEALVDVDDRLITNEFMRWSTQGLRAWVVARQAPTAGIPLLEEVLDAIGRSAQQLWRVLFELMLASFHAAAGDHAAAHEIARRARLVAAAQIPIHHAEALRLEALAAHHDGEEPAEVDRLLSDAIAVATTQGAVPYVQRARAAAAAVAADRRR